MKGLLTKDLLLLFSQKRFCLFVLSFAVVITILTASATFSIGYATFLGGLFALTTVNYDELEDGYAFLFTLPITRKQYALEKYIFGSIMGAFFCFLATAFGLTANWVMGLRESTAIVNVSLFTYVLLMFFLSIVIPLHFRFNGEKARMVLLVLIAAGIGFTFSMGTMGVLDGGMLAMFSNVMNSLWVIAALALALSLSYLLSVRILNKKDF